MKNATYAVLFVLVLAASATWPVGADADVRKDTSGALRISVSSRRRLHRRRLSGQARQGVGQIPILRGRRDGHGLRAQPQSLGCQLAGLPQDLLRDVEALPRAPVRQAYRRHGEGQADQTGVGGEDQPRRARRSFRSPRRDRRYPWSKNGGPWIENGAAFTQFLAHLNAGEGYAGSNGWRLPNLVELLTLFDESGTRMVPASPMPRTTRREATGPRRPIRPPTRAAVPHRSAPGTSSSSRRRTRFRRDWEPSTWMERGKPSRPCCPRRSLIV